VELPVLSLLTPPVWVLAVSVPVVVVEPVASVPWAVTFWLRSTLVESELLLVAAAALPELCSLLLLLFRLLLTVLAVLLSLLLEEVSLASLFVLSKYSPDSSLLALLWELWTPLLNLSR